MPEVGPLSWMGLIIRDDDTGGSGTRRYEPPNGAMMIQLQGTIQQVRETGVQRLLLASTLTWNDPLPRSENYTIWRYDVFTGWKSINDETRSDDPKTYIDTAPSLANDTIYKYRIQNGNDISNDLVLPAFFAEEATP
jgi:hypothetical protein